VSGAFSVTDTDAALRLLERTLPVRINSFTRYWITVDAA
jgi:transmembrane sensor